MAPEQAAGLREAVGPTTDVYALGVLLYEILVGRPPHQAVTVGELIVKIISEAPPRPRALRPDLPDALDIITSKALSKQPSQRYATAGAFAEDLARYLDGRSILARSPSRANRVIKTVRAHRGAATAAVVAALALLCAIGFGIRVRLERADALSYARATAEMAVNDALVARRQGKRSEMKRFLPRLEQACQRARARGADLAEIDSLMGRMHWALMDDAAALVFQDRALAVNPGYAPALYERILLSSEALGVARQWQLDSASDDGAPAETLHRKMIADLAGLENALAGAAPPPGKLLVARALLAEAEGRFDETIRLLEPVVKTYPRNEGAWMGLGRAHIGRARTAATDDEKLAALRTAELVWAAAIEFDRGFTPYWMERAVAREWQAAIKARGGDGSSLADYRAAAGFLLELIRVAGRDARAWMRLGHLQTLIAEATAGDGVQGLLDGWNEAELSLSRAIELDAGNPTAWVWRANVRFRRAGLPKSLSAVERLAAWASAEADCTRALTLAPIPRGTQDSPGSAPWAQRGQIRAARARFLIERQDGDPIADWAGAEADFSEAIALKADATSWYHRGLVRFERGSYLAVRGRDPLVDWRAAETDMSESVRRGVPSPATVYSSLAALHRRLQSRSAGPKVAPPKGSSR
jgi:tetratricopeptide (TPR) repeat protein